MGINKKILAISVIIIFLSLSLSGCNNQTAQKSGTDGSSVDGQLSIACWNLQVFGPTKASNATLMNYYQSKLSQYDIFIIQEIRDSYNKATNALADKFSGYEMRTSNRAGTTDSKEQYAVFYKPSKVKLLELTDYTSTYQDRFERPPLKVKFSCDQWTFTIYTMHADPDKVTVELSYLQQLVGTPTEDTIIIGDLNADGNYYNENNKANFQDWNWVIGNDVDTTVAQSSNTYDRIILNKNAEDNYLRSGIMNDVKLEQSDHYLIYATFSTSHS